MTAGEVKAADITGHTTKVMDNGKRLVEQGGGSSKSILPPTVYLGSLDYDDAMNKTFKNYFPQGGPARTTAFVAGVPGHPLPEINCIPAVVRK
jgi:enamine deaminase RidA (YjgF/YER057c/UK114 family)